MNLNKQDIAGRFEDICKICFRKMLPEPWRVFQSTAGSADRANLGLTLTQFVHSVADNIQEAVSSEFDSKRRVAGDGGIDLFAAWPFSDGAGGTLTIFAQCAAREEDWYGKSSEAHPDKLEWMFGRFTSRPMHALFIPQFFRSDAGDWYESKAIMKAILIDRYRICKILCDGTDLSNFIPEKTVELEF